MAIYLYRLNPTQKQNETLYDLCSNYAQLCDEVAVIVRKLRSRNENGQMPDRESVNKYIRGQASFKEASDDTVANSPRWVPSRYLTLATNRVMRDLAVDPDKHYNGGRDAVNLDGDVVTHKTNALFEHPFNQMTIKLFGTDTGVREAVDIASVEPTDEFDLKHGQAILIHDQTTDWRIVVGVDEKAKRSEKREEDDEQDEKGDE